MAPTFLRRAAAGLIDLTICLALSVAVMAVWTLTQVEPCVCATMATREHYLAEVATTAETMPESLAVTPALLYVLLSWTPIAGRRSIGKRVTRIRAIVTRE